MCLMLGEQKERQRAPEAMEKSLDAVLSINEIVGRLLLYPQLSDPWYLVVCWKTCFLGL